MKKLLPLLLLALWLPAHAETGNHIVRYTFEGTFSTMLTPSAQSFALNDPFVLQIDLDLESVARHSGTSASYSLTNLAFALGPTASGNYAGGHITGSATLLLISQDSYSEISVIIQRSDPNVGAVFADAAGLSFQYLQLSLVGNNHDSFTLQEGQDVALGDVFRTLNLDHFDSDKSVYLEFSDDRWMYGDVDSITDTDLSDGGAIPEPSTYAAFAGLAALGLTLVIRRRSRNAR